MKKSRLVILMQSLSKKEIRDFRKYLHSPFFNQRDDVIKLFAYLSDCIYAQQRIPKKQELFAEIYPEQAYDDHRIRLILSFCFKHLERFLVYQYYFSEKPKWKLKLAQIYKERQLPKHFKRSIVEADQLLHQEPTRNSDYYNTLLNIELERSEMLDSKRTDAKNLQSLSENIDKAYFTKKLQLICASVAHQSVFKSDYDFGMLQEILDYIEKQGLLEVPAIALYYYGYFAFTAKNGRPYYQKLKHSLAQHYKLFPEKELGDLFFLAINYCVKQMNLGDKVYQKEVLDLYKEGLDKGYLIINGKLSRYTYKNITSIGLLQKDYEWVEQFLPQYKKLLDKNHRDANYSFNTARLEYARGNFDSALTLLQKAEYDDLLLNLSAKTIALKIYYELNEISLLESHLDAMKNFIRRKKDISYHTTLYLNLIKFTKKLLKLKTFDKTAREKLLQQLEAEKAVAEKSWLRKQIER